MKHSLDCALAQGKYKTRGHWQVAVTTQFSISTATYVFLRLWGEANGVHVLFFYA